MRLLNRTRTAALVTSVVLSVPVPVTNGSLLSVVDSAAQRLSVADLVAAAKFPDQPITDKAREQKVLDEAAAQASAHGVDPAFAVRIFRDQIEAAKVVEYGLFARWTAHPEQAPKRRPDLPTEVRPKIDKIDADLITELSTVHPAAGCGLKVSLDVTLTELRHGFDELHRTGLRRGVPSLCS